MLSRRRFTHQMLAATTAIGALTGKMARAQDRPGITADAPAPAPEWASHKFCVMAWCAQHDLFDPVEIRAIHSEQAVLARAISVFEPVAVLVNPEDMADAEQQLGKDILLIDLPHDDIWTRDTLPVMAITPSAPLGVNLNFNGWGDEFLPGNGPDPYASDKTLASRFLQQQDIDEQKAPLVAEGGAIEMDGTGTLITTETCLLTRSRNPGMDKSDIAQAFRETLGIKKIIWLYGSDADTVTDGHVDGMTRYVAPGVVVTEVTDDRQDPEYRDLQENLARLKSARDALGNRLEIHTIQRPYWDEMPERGDDFAASYANFYLPNGGVIMAEFGDRARDRAARRTLQRLFPDRKVIAVRTDNISEGGGGIHCNTWQMPAW